jgi:nitrous oxide reductase accessory protein NosL
MKNLVIGLLLLACTSAWAGSAMAQDKLEPGREDKCPVCGMFVYKYPEWVAAIVYLDDTTVFFDGAKDMFKYYHNLSHYAPDRKLEDIDSVWVKDYYELEMIDAKKAFFVIGSQVYGPMGKELIPLITEEDARTFIEDHQGKTMVRFDDVTPDLLKGLD